MNETSVDCRSPEGIVTGLIDAIISICRVLAAMDFDHPAVVEALKDLQQDEDVSAVMQRGSHVQ